VASKINTDAAYCQQLQWSLDLSEKARKLNVYACTLIIIIGIVGNGLGVFVFAQRRFRNHSSSIYLLFLYLSDGLFLLVHLFEDTLRTALDLYSPEPSAAAAAKDPHCSPSILFSSTSSAYSNSTSRESTRSVSETLLRMLNFTDQLNVACRSVNFLRYFLRFLSAYLIVAFTAQRTMVLRRPLHRIKFESNRLTWLVVKTLVLIGVVVNIWVCKHSYSKKSKQKTRKPIQNLYKIQTNIKPANPNKKIKFIFL
jgi:hypothetical protein